MNQYPCDKHTLYLSQQAKEKKKQQQQQKTNMDHCKQQGTVGKHTKTTTQGTQLLWENTPRPPLKAHNSLSNKSIPL